MKSTLAELSLEFSVLVIGMCDHIHHRAHIKNQLLRSACSIGANIREAQYGYSKADFICKLQIALKECHETFYWLELLVRTQTVTPEIAKPIENMCSKIRFLLIKSLNTAKQGEI